MLSDNMRRGGDGRDAKRRVEPLILRGKGHCKLQENGWSEVGRGGLLAFAFQETQEDGYHTLNLLPNLFFPQKSIWIIRVWIIGVILYFKLLLTQYQEYK
jgi:hypothetical protein